jgi:hypothetical protein
MKYIKKYESFNTEEEINEEFLGKIMGGIKNLFKKGMERINKTRGGMEIEKIYQKYLTQLNDQLSKSAQIDLNIAAAAKGEEPAKPAVPTTPGVEAQKESLSYSVESINEADEANAKLAADTLKKKKSIMDQIVVKTKEMAIKEMEKVLAKYGGAAENPQLSAILQSKKDEFDMAYLNAQISYLDKAGDKTMIAELSKKRDIISKSIEAKMKDFDSLKPIEYTEGDEVIYLRNGKKPEEYNKTKKPEEQKTIVGIHKIVKIDGDNFTLEDENGKPTILKKSSEIMGKVATASGEEKVGEGTLVLTWGDVEIEIELPKEGGTTRYKIIKSNSQKLIASKEKSVFCDISGEVKKGGKVKLEKLSIETGDPLKIDGQDFYETGDIEKITLDGKEVDNYKFEGEEADVEVDLQKKLGDIKAKNPEGLKKIASYASFIADEKNKDKIDEIEKIIGGGADAQ